MSVYEATVDPGARNTSHMLMLELIRPDSDVLDVGCASGYLAEALGKMGCRVSGIEVDPQEAEKARPFLQELVIADLNEVDLAVEFSSQSFDVIVFGDVLEHLADPQTVLASALPLLRPQGRVVISIPNIAHGSVRLALLQGRWRYTQTGLLDRSHMRFFTLGSLHDLLTDAGLQAIELRATVADVLDTEVTIDIDDLPAHTIQWVREQPNADVYQFVVSARVGGNDSDNGLFSAVESPRPPVRDLHTEIAQLHAEAAELRAAIDKQGAEIAGLRRRALTHRDFAIGSEAQIARMSAELTAARAESARIGAESARMRADHEAFLARLEAHRVRSAIAVVLGPQLWAVFTQPVRAILRIVRRAQ